VRPEGREGRRGRWKRREHARMGKGGDQQTATRPRREDFLYSEQASGGCLSRTAPELRFKRIRDAALNRSGAAEARRACVQPAGGCPQL